MGHDSREHSRGNDLDVNPMKGKTNQHRASGTDEAVRLTPFETQPEGYSLY